MDLLTWFICAESIISNYARGTELVSLTGHGLAERLGISYVAAVRLKKSLMVDLSRSGGGFIGRCICVEHVFLSQDMASDGREYFEWLSTAMPGNKFFRRND